MGTGMQFASKLLGNQPLFDTPTPPATSHPNGIQQPTNSPSRTAEPPVNATISSPGGSIQLGPNPQGNRPVTRRMTEQEVEALRAQAGISTPSSEIQLGSSDGNFESVASLPTSFQPGSDTSSLPKLGAPTSLAHKPGIEPLNANTRAFSLDYKIENDPGAPITEVELWGTIDQGRTWEVWGQDPDRKSPFDIEVENDGLFGFRMVIVGANGLASNRPRSGDDADAWIQVDTQKPTARITSALYGKGQDSGSLIIEYTVVDDFLPERPISLYFSESTQGPWEPISRGIRNQGRFVWPTTPNLPAKLYLRIEATDLAGNITGSTLDLPIDIEGIAPRGRIQGFRPLTPTAP